MVVVKWSAWMANRSMFLGTRGLLSRRCQNGLSSLCSVSRTTNLAAVDVVAMT
jgi:hypothetical protein